MRLFDYSNPENLGNGIIALSVSLVKISQGFTKAAE